MVVLTCCSTFLHAQLLPTVEKKAPAPKPVVKPAPKPAVKPVAKPVVKEEIQPSQKAISAKPTKKIDLGSGIIFRDDYSYSEDFSVTAGIWHLGKDEEKEWKHQNGKLRMVGINDQYAYHMRESFTQLDVNKDFTFSALVKYIEGKNTQPFGLVYLSSSKQKNHFFISADGGYKLSAKKGDDWSEVVGWKKSSSILSGSSPNLMEVRKKGPMLEFLVNGTVLERIPDDNQGNNQFGFYNQAKHIVEFDNVAIVGKKKTFSISCLTDEDGYVFLDKGGIEVNEGIETPLTLPIGSHRLKFISRADPSQEFVFYVSPQEDMKVHLNFQQMKSSRRLNPSGRASLVPFMDQSTGLWGFSESVSMKPVIPAIYDYADSMRDGIATVSRAGAFYKINGIGQPLLITGVPFESNAGKIYIIDNKDNAIIELNPSGAEFSIPKFNGDDYAYEEMNWENPIAFSLSSADIDGDREHQLEFLFDRKRRQFFQEGSTEPGTEGTIKLIIDQKYGFIDTMNRMLIPPMYDDSENFSNGLSAVKLNKKWGMVDKMNNTIIPFDYSYIAPRFVNNMIWASKDGNEFVLLNSFGGLANSKKFDDVNSFAEGLCPVKLNDKWGVVDTNINIVIQPKFDSLGYSFAQGLIAAKSGKFWGYVDRTGTWVIPPKYEWYRAFANGKSLVAQKGKWGIINSRGETIIPLIYDYIKIISEPYPNIIVEINKKRSLLDGTGRPLISSPSYESIGVESHGIFWARYGSGQFHYFDWRGKKLSN